MTQPMRSSGYRHASTPGRSELPSLWRERESFAMWEALLHNSGLRVLGILTAGGNHEAKAY